MNDKKEFSLQYLASYLSAELIGDVDAHISGLADLNSAGEHDISFLSDSKYVKHLESSVAAAVVLRANDVEFFAGNKLVVSDPYRAYAALSKLFATRKPFEGIHPTAVVSDSAKIAENVSIGPNCVVGDGVSIGQGTELSAGVFVGDGASLGANCLLHPNVVVYHQCVLGDRVLIHANTSIGSDGFGFAPASGKWEKIHQIGRVVIGNDVEIGANTAIDRGALEDTVIHSDVIIDNQVHIAHNCVVGSGTALAGCVGIAGSAKIGENCLVGGAVAIGGHLEIADGTMFNGGTIVPKGVKEKGVYASSGPMQEAGEWRKNSARYRQLDSLYRRIVKLEKTIEEQVQKDNNT